MSLEERLKEDLKTAMRSGNTLARDTLRMALAAAKNLRIEKRADLSEAEFEGVLAKEDKKRQDAAEQYSAAGRKDRAETEKAEARILAAYLPAKLSLDETKALLEKLASELGAQSKKDTGKLMKALAADHKGRVDMKLAQRLLKEILS